ncbi:CDPK-related kinase 1-like [Bidens hawaiensis]|uniref:CDPK-related kinase 1-like n=1 Tax=Bidens hawaiensis TaxID=980011 RepID=UPI00404AC69A
MVLCSANKRHDTDDSETLEFKTNEAMKMTVAISIEDVHPEVKLLKSLSGHQHMVQFHDAFEDDQNVYIVMELCEGGELLDCILARGGRYTENDAQSIVVQILSVASFCHLQGVVHRNLKPEVFIVS